MELIIFPKSGNALEAAECFDSNVNIIGFIDDSNIEKMSNYYGYKVLNRNSLLDYPNARLLAVPGSAKSFKQRKTIIDSITGPSERFAKAIHPTAVISKSAKIGTNVFISAGCIIGPHTVVGDHVIILANTVLHHNSTIKDYSIVCGGVVIAGNVNIGEQSYIGAGVTIKDNINIGNNVLIGSGSNVIRPISDSQKVIGNPAKSI